MQEPEPCTPDIRLLFLIPVSVFTLVVFPFAAVEPFPLVLITVRVVAALPLEVTGFALPAVVVLLVVEVVVSIIIFGHGRPHSTRDGGGGRGAGGSALSRGAMVRPPARHIRISVVFIGNESLAHDVRMFQFE